MSPSDQTLALDQCETTKVLPKYFPCVPHYSFCSSCLRVPCIRSVSQVSHAPMSVSPTISVLSSCVFVLRICLAYCFIFIIPCPVLVLQFCFLPVLLCQIRSSCVSLLSSLVTVCVYIVLVSLCLLLDHLFVIRQAQLSHI